ncbi:hypothetical protein [Actinomadura rifamycini]|uniref:hypothetical protein n=1 Tax=Actinomadura rifamycini TaxID=31962 RepID=UPI00047C56AB|nr:hypothetical protein [Actinomadura rifamycini]
MSCAACTRVACAAAPPQPPAPGAGQPCSAANAGAAAGSVSRSGIVQLRSRASSRAVSARVVQTRPGAADG